MYLVADLGNTQLKLALFTTKGIQEVKKFDSKIDTSSIFSFLGSLDKKFPCILSSVVEKDNEIEKFLNKKFKVIYLNTKTKLPIVNVYKTPKTLGQDRLANAAAAAQEFPKQAVLSIDMGTCIKYDFITKNSEYLGGAISPGLQMRFQSLNNHTGRLPKVKEKREASLIGENTEGSILSGVINGIRFEIEGVIEEYKKLHDPLIIVLTGGDHKRFVEELKYPIFARPNLTLEGLFYILKINENK